MTRDTIFQENLKFAQEYSENMGTIMAQALDGPVIHRSPEGELFSDYDLKTKTVAFEFKAERTYPKTLYIERMSGGKPSGIVTTKADVWFHRGVDGKFYVARVDTIRSFIKAHPKLRVAGRFNNNQTLELQREEGYIIETSRWKEIEGATIITECHWETCAGYLEKDGYWKWELFGLLFELNGKEYWHPLVFSGYLPTAAEYAAIVDNADPSTRWLYRHENGSAIAVVDNYSTDPYTRATQQFFERNMYTSEVKKGGVYIVDMNVLVYKQASPASLIVTLKTSIPPRNHVVNGLPTAKLARENKMKLLKQSLVRWAPAQAAKLRQQIAARKELRDREFEKYNAENPLSPGELQQVQDAMKEFDTP